MKFLFSILFIFIIANSFGQVVNIEKKRSDSLKNGWQGNVDLSLSFIKNTNDITQGKTNFKLQHHKDKSTYLFFNDITIMSINGERYLNSGFQHLRYNYDFDKFYIAEAFTQIQYNKIQKLQRRFLWGGGLRYRIFDEKRLSLNAGTSLMYEFEMLLDDSFADKIRGNIYISTTYKPKESFSVEHITYYQPAFGSGNDYRISSETTLKFKISDKLTYKTFFNLFYDSKPPVEIPNLFYSLNNGLSYSF